MLQNLENAFNEAIDIMEAVPNLATDLGDALRTGVIKSSGVDLSYSKETSTDEVGSYIRDNIDMYAAAKSLNKSMAAERAAATQTE